MAEDGEDVQAETVRFKTRNIDEGVASVISSDTQFLFIGEGNHSNATTISIQAIRVIEASQKAGFVGKYIAMEFAPGEDIERYLRDHSELIKYAEDHGIKVVGIDVKSRGRSKISEQGMLDNIENKTPSDEKIYVFVGARHAQLESNNLSMIATENLDEAVQYNYPHLAQLVAERFGKNKVASIAIYRTPKESTKDDWISKMADLKRGAISLSGGNINSFARLSGMDGHLVGETSPEAHQLLVLMPSNEYLINQHLDNKSS